MEQCIVLKTFSMPHLLFFTEKQAVRLSVWLCLTQAFHYVGLTGLCFIACKYIDNKVELK